jgi:hypothetical protein
MTSRRVRRSKSLSKQCMELAIAVPQVVAHRTARVARAGPIVSERDRREFQRMVNEKQAAFTQACAEMALQMFRVNLQLASTLFWTFFYPSSLTAPSMAAAVAQSRHAAESVLGKGLAPIHRTAVSNVRRLSKIPLR